MKNKSIFKRVKYNPILHDEINKYLKEPDDILWENKLSKFIFRGINSGNPFSCIKYEWNKERASRCDLLLASLKLPEYLKTMVDIGFNKLYPKNRELKKNIGDVDYLKSKFLNSLTPDKNINDLQNEIALILKHIKPSISRKDILNYKYILCPEGFDCSSSLCWVLASNSLAVVPPFHYENIIINSKYLKPYVNFLPIKEDYSDLGDIINWAINNDQACKEMVKNANAYMKHFLDENSMLFVQKTIIQRLLS